MSRDRIDRALRLLEHALIAAEQASAMAQTGCFWSEYKTKIQLAEAALWTARGLISEVSAEIVIEKAKR